MRKDIDHTPKLLWNNYLTYGFTLVELLIVMIIISIIIVIVLSAINPIEQIHKVEDSSNERRASELLNAIERYQTTGENPEIINSANSYVCDDIISAGPVVITDSLTIRNELSDWFVRQIRDRGTELYAGILSGNARVCYQVKSIRNIELSLDGGCRSGYLYFRCLPR